MNHQFIPITQPDRWTQALQDVAHPYAHCWEYCAAMAKSSGLEFYLYLGDAEGEKVVCPLSVREREGGYPELVSPYGFGGMVTTNQTGSLHGFRSEWVNFARDKGFVTGYIMQHPAFRLSPETWSEDLYEDHVLYLIDLTMDLDRIWKGMRKTHRYEIRRMERESAFDIVDNRRKLIEAMLQLYPETMERVGASRVYNFSTATLEQLANAPETVLVGVKEKSTVHAVVLFLHTPWIAEYFLNATSPQGRKYTRLLVWTAIKALKRSNVAWLNLGGGVKPGDSLDQFKRRFGGKMVRGQVLRQIFDQEKYSYLCCKYSPNNDGTGEAGYFPPYWSDRVE